MCTAVTITAGDHYFGRNLDYEHGFGEKIVITPRAKAFAFRGGETVTQHYAMIGMALPMDGYPLYFDATNEKGLSMAGLRFAGYADYTAAQNGKKNVASFEIIPWVLSQCANVAEAEQLLGECHITAEAFRAELPPSALHWMIADRDRAIVVEQTRDGLLIFDNPTGVLTNNPTFDLQLFQLNNYRALSVGEGENRFAPQMDLSCYSRGMGALGLPGDYSSMSRFVRAAFVRAHAIFAGSEEEKVSQFFHVLSSVSQPQGCVLANGGWERTNYASCCNAQRGIYYYTTYHNSRIYGVDMHAEPLDGREIVVYDLMPTESITLQNGREG